MTMRLSRCEYWLLENAVEHPIPTPWLTADNLETCLNKKGHGVSNEEVTRSVTELVTQGLIEIIPPAVDSASRTLALPEDSALHELLQREQYQLTPEGGAAWERFARPDWNMYVRFEGMSDENGNEQARVETADLALAEEYVTGLHYTGYSVASETLRQSRLSPWHPTYWKTLEVGSRLSFDYTDTDNHVDWGAIPTSYMNIYSSRWYRWQT